MQLGQGIRIEPNGLTAKVTEIITPKGEVTQAVAGEVITLRLDRDIDISRGDLFVDESSPLTPQKQLEATICWFDERPLNTRVRLSLQKPIVATTYEENIAGGAFILVDEATYNTVAAGMIL